MSREAPQLSSSARTLTADLVGRMHTFGTLVSVHRGRLFVVGIILLGALTCLASWVQSSVRRSVERQLAAQLSVTLEAAVSGLVAEIESGERSARAASRSVQLQQQLAVCLAQVGGCQLGPSQRVALEEALRPHMTTGRFSSAQIFDPAGKLLLQLPATDNPAEPLGSAREPTLGLGEHEAAELSLVLPLPLAERGQAWLRVSLPLASCTRVLRVARAGASGETYAFDRQGRLLSESRFTDKLRELGVIARDRESAVLAFTLRDPGGDLAAGHRPSGPRAQLPLTRMVGATLARGSAVDVTGYRDYRGVQVVGAGRFVPRLGIGVVSELDSAEAFRGLAELERIWLVLVLVLGLLSLALLGVAIATARLQRRALRAEQVAAKFGQYDLERKLGEGGMGTVYLARHALLRRPAAIKVLRPALLTREAAERFEREAQITSRLSHPNTVAIYDHGRTEDGSIYYVMEYLEGLDLQRLVETRGPLSPARVVHLLRQLCGSLSEAHALGLVHRDIKPANLMVCRRGGIPDTLKVVDFGVAKSTRLEQVGLTANKLLLGTPMYMAPELFESSEQASPQSDLYALGAVAYFLLTAETVFEAASPMELCMAHLTRTPEPLAARLPELDPQLDAIICACLAKRRDARPKSAAAVLALLERCPLAQRWTSADAEACWAEHVDDERPAGGGASDAGPVASIRPLV